MDDIATSSPARPSGWRRVAPALALFFLAPLIGEFLLGNLRFSDLALLPFLAPLYGAGALLIREVARRFGCGPVAMLLLGVAYALVEEGLADQMLFNHDYFDGQAEGSDTVVFGVDVWLALIVVAMHAVWSTFVPITLVEALTPRRRTTPWLGSFGLGVTAAVFVCGVVFVAWAVYDETGFFASPAQLATTTAVIALFVWLAFVVRRRPGASTRPAPRPWVAGTFALVASSLYMLTEELPGWAEVAGCLALIVMFAGTVSVWAHRAGWGVRHRLALVGGALLTYCWLGSVMEPETGARGVVDWVGRVVLVCGALALLVVAARRVRDE